MATTILSTNKDPKSKKGNVIGRFLQSHVLGLMARLTDVINDSITLQPLIMEQRSAIATLEEMLKVCKQYVRVARPQVRPYSILRILSPNVPLDIGLPSCSHFAGIFTRSLLFLLGCNARLFGRRRR